jgi:hypothetical protein
MANNWQFILGSPVSNAEGPAFLDKGLNEC